MKICAMCGSKILNSMIPFQIMMPSADMKTIDSCGRCFLLTRINDSLQTLALSKEEVQLGKH